jgi:hypothetical protein
MYLSHKRKSFSCSYAIDLEVSFVTRLDSKRSSARAWRGTCVAIGLVVRYWKDKHEVDSCKLLSPPPPLPQHASALAHTRTYALVVSSFMTYCLLRSLVIALIWQPRLTTNLKVAPTGIPPQAKRRPPHFTARPENGNLKAYNLWYIQLQSPEQA